MSTVWILLAILFLFSLVISFRKRRDERLHQIRANWGKPVDHARQMAALADSHASRVGVTEGAISVDHRTWANGNPLMLSFDSSPVSIMFSDLIGALYEYLNLFLLLDATGVYFGVRDLRAHRISLLRVIAAVGDVDTAISVASYREGRDDWTRPQFHSEAAVTLTDLRHPLICDAVPNSIVLRAGRGALVAGSNMSGKSTFLRTVGVNAILAQTLNTCLARDYTGPRFVVRSCIGRSDDLLAGKSYYIVEVEALLGLAFDHRLNSGPATTRTAIALLAQHGAPQRLLARATATTAMLDRQRNP